MKYFLPILLLISIVSACGGGSGSSHSDNKDYRLFPSQYLSSTYSETYTLKGENQIGIPYNGTYNVERRPETTINNQSAIPVFEFLRYTNLFTNAVIASTSYYTGSLSQLEIIDISSSLQPGLVTASADTSVIPLTAKIGESGDIGTYTDNVSNTTVYTWELTKAKNGKAKLILYGSITDQHDDITGTVETSYDINTEGERSNISIILESKKQGITLTFSGDKD